MTGNMNIQEFNSLKNLYTALILGGAEKVSTELKRVDIKKDRHGILYSYILQNNLKDYFSFSTLSESSNIVFEDTIFSKQLFKEWSASENEIEYISPNQLNVNVLNLWVSLFGEKKKKRIYIPCRHITPAAQDTFVFFFNRIVNVRLETNGAMFFIPNSLKWFAQSYQARRPIYEINPFISTEIQDALRAERNKIFIETGNILI